MFNPLLDDYTQLTDEQLRERIHEATRKYYLTGDQNIQYQLATILDLYVNEQTKRIQSASVVQDNPFDDLISVN